MKKVSEIINFGPEGPQDFADYLNAYASDVGEVVNSYLPKSVHSEINRYLYDPLFAYGANYGKCHRPLICFAACRAVGGDVDKATSAASAIEHFHNAALIHDDIADESHLRRGVACLHITEGIGAAINMGDLALSLVNGTVAKDPLLDDALKVRVIRELVDMTQRTIEGQALDIAWARDGRFDLSTDDYLLMAEHKTAFYSGGVPLAIGAIIGGGTEEQIETLRAYGMDAGLAFQIQDDLLNLIGTKESTKKDFRSDITEGKRTLMVVHALEHSAHADRLIEILSSKTTEPQELAKAVEIMQEAGSLDYARSYAAHITDESIARVSEVLPESTARNLLLSMSKFFVNRLS
ncbi:MAG: polyprenyl synthetase family protein [Eggerthellaceae bacterium]|jgi:geranylgeranyl diphosphate synthase type I